MDYAALRLFLHLGRTLHFTRTSRECGVSVSALSRTIGRLEEELGCPLFVRDRRSVALSRQGELFREHAADALGRYQAVRERLVEEGELLRGAIRVFASVTAVQSFLPRVLSSFRRSYPQIRIDLETGYAQDALGMLARGAVERSAERSAESGRREPVDVSVAALPRRIPAELEARVIVVTPLVLVAPASECEVSQAVERRPVPWHEVPFVLPPAGLARQATDRWFARRRLRPRVYGEVAGNEAILSLVSLGCGVGVVPRLVVDKSPLRAEVQVLDGERIGELRVGVCTDRRSLRSAIVRAFWDSIDSGQA